MDLRRMMKPNFIFILIDDLGWSDPGCYGSSFHQTTHIDRLSAEGMHFTDAYAACPVCSPTRASILTGKYPANVGVTDWIDWGGQLHPARGRVIDAGYTDHLPLEEHALSRALKEGGYTAWHIGKWHLGHTPYYPDKHGFDMNIGGGQWGLPRKGYFSPWGVENLADGPEGEYLTDHLTDEAIRLIQHHAETPFYLNLWYYAVHTPIQAKQDIIQKYEAKAKSMGLDQQKTFEEGKPFPCEHKKDQRIQRRLLQSDPVYAAMIENLDANIGRLLKAVDEAGLTDNTVIILTSDNGGLATSEGSPTCNTPLAEGKGWLYEGGIRVPLIVKWPSVIRPGSRSDVLVTSPDFYPTMLAMAGLDLIPEQHCDGVSLLPLLTKTGMLEREAIFWHYPHYGNQGGTPGSAVRWADYKLIEFFEDGRVELYNLRDDLSEEHDLTPTRPELTEKLKRMLAEWRENVAAKIPEPNPDYRP